MKPHTLVKPSHHFCTRTSLPHFILLSLTTAARIALRSWLGLLPSALGNALNLPSSQESHFQPDGRASCGPLRKASLTLRRSSLITCCLATRISVTGGTALLGS